jgi:hypothetical protein
MTQSTLLSRLDTAIQTTNAERLADHRRALEFLGERLEREGIDVEQAIVTSSNWMSPHPVGHSAPVARAFSATAPPRTGHRRTKTRGHRRAADVDGHDPLRLATHPLG